MVCATPHFTKRSAGTPTVVWAGGKAGHLLALRSLLQVAGVPEESRRWVSDCSRLSLLCSLWGKGAPGGVLMAGRGPNVCPAPQEEAALSRESGGGQTLSFTEMC